MLLLRYRVVDVFAERVLEGNPLAVFYDGAVLEGATMQRIARELNLSETTFVLPPTQPACDVRVRIFTPTMEMAFAGHPTLGSAFVALAEGLASARDGAIVLEELVGPVPVRIESGERPRLWLRTPPISFGATFERSLCARVCGLDEPDLIASAPPQLVSAGNPTVYVAVRDPACVDRAWVELAGVRELGAGAATCVFVFAPTPSGAYARMFAPEHGVVEDPATGSSTGPLAAYMMRYGLAAHVGGTELTSVQGVKMGRPSRLDIRVHGDFGVDGIDVGGRVIPLVRAEMSLDITGE